MKKRLLSAVFFLVFYCTVSGQVWSPKAVGVLPANYGIDDICIVNEQVIWATANSGSTPVPAGYVSKLLRSTDGGETWTATDIEEAMGRFCWDIYAFDANTACVATTNRGSGNKQGIFRTTDGGATWTEVFNHAAGGTWLHFFDGQEGLCFQGTDIARTTNAGLTWTVVPGANIPNFLPGEGWGGAALSNSIGTFGNSVWFGTSKGRVFKTENRGQNWTAHNTGLGANSFLYSFGFIDEKNGLGVFDIAGVAELARTSDGGINWVKTGNFDFTVVDAIPCANTFMGASYNAGSERTAFSTNHGTSWMVRDTTIAANAHVFVSPDLGWTANVAAVGTGPALYKWTGGSLDTRIYVNPTATGANNGASWADAYTALQTALAAALAGDEIWVAEGIYKPAAPGGSQTATFLINKDLKLYGGFAGAECYLSERDIELYPTVLSGDLNGDDLAGDLQTNRADNTGHVMRINIPVGNQMLLDGFTIIGGHADGSGGQTDGGGLYCFGAPVIRNCVFENNYAQGSGGGLAFNGVGTNGARVEHCRFEKNRAEDTFDAGGGLYTRLAGGAGIFVDHCVFLENTVASRGAGLGCNGSNLSVTNTLFSGNINDEQGGGLWFWPGDVLRTLVVDSCRFENNHSSFGGGLYASIASNSSVSVSRSVFNGNVVSPNTKGWGQSSAGLNIISPETSLHASVSIDQIRFTNNHSSNGAGGLGITLLGDSANVAVTNCLFEANRCTYYGSALGSSFGGKDNSCLLKNCRFFQNIADSSTATADLWADFNGSGIHTIDSCLFEENVASAIAGLSLSAFDGGKADFLLTNSIFKNNRATDEGGALGIYSTGHALDALSAVVENCVFEGNSSGERAGAIVLWPQNDQFEVLISRSTIVNNESPSMGAIGSYYYEPATFFTGATIRIENSLIAGNESTDAAIFADSTGHFSLLNCTVANNQGGGIQLSDQSGLRLQNTILHNPGFLNYEALTADVSYTSGGGNLSGDGSLSVTSTDKQNTDPLLSGDFHILAGSPCIDMGVDLGNLSALDLDGNPRVFGTAVDIGAYESGFTPVREVIAGEVRVSPNPATAFLNLQLPEAAAGQMDVEVFDTQGKMAFRRALGAGQALDVSGLGMGMYTLKVVMGERVYAGQFVKL